MEAGLELTPGRVERELVDLLVGEFFVNRDDIKPETHLIADLELDSLDLMAALATFEDRYSLSVTTDELPEMVIVGKFVARITARLQAGA